MRDKDIIGEARANYVDGNLWVIIEIYNKHLFPKVVNYLRSEGINVEINNDKDEDTD